MRLALVADIHGNLLALEAVVADIATRRVDAVLNLGDCVSGPLWPRDTLALLRSLGWATVRGNHDRCVGTGDIASLSRTDAYTAGTLDAEGRRWLATLPVRLAPAAGLLAIHACPEDDEAYLLEDIVDGRLRAASHAAVGARLGPDGASVVFTAHSHRAALVRLPDGHAILNPGSVGCPAYHDPAPPAHVAEAGSPDARYAVAEVATDGPSAQLGTVELIAVPYDHAAAARRAASLGRPDWSHALLHGCMPGAEA